MDMVCIDPTKTLTRGKVYDALDVGKKYSWLHNDKGCLVKVRASRFTDMKDAKKEVKKVPKRSVNTMCKFFYKCENGLANVDCCKEPGHFKCYNKGFTEKDQWEVHVNGCDEQGRTATITAVNRFKEQFEKGEINEERYGEILNLIADTLQFGEMYENPEIDEMKRYEDLGIAHLIEEADIMEISVIRKDNKHGHESYGWGGIDKIILFGVCCGGDSNSIDVDGLEPAMKIAHGLCAVMNKEEL